jgi:hypothetical protein
MSQLPPTKPPGKFAMTGWVSQIRNAVAALECSTRPYGLVEDRAIAGTQFFLGFLKFLAGSGGDRDNDPTFTYELYSDASLTSLIATEVLGNQFWEPFTYIRAPDGSPCIYFIGEDGDPQVILSAERPNVGDCAFFEELIGGF